MKKFKKNIETPEEAAKRELKHKLYFVMESVKWSRIRPIGWTFDIGEVCTYGGFDKTVILESFENGLYYKVNTFQKVKVNNYSKETKNVEEEKFAPWYSLFKINQNRKEFAIKDVIDLHYGTTDLDSMLHRCHFFGVDFDVDYQRGYVWEQKDKEALIESIFNKCDIGKFVFVQRPLSSPPDEPHYEIVDGKQRLSTLLDFTEDQITYKGLKFSQLSPMDRYAIKGARISYADISGEQYNKKQILNMFYRLNRHGKVMDQTNLEKVKEMIGALELNETY